MFDNLRADFEAAQADRKLETGFWRVLLHIEAPALVCYRFSHWALKIRVPLLRQILIVFSMIFQRFVQMSLGIFISPDAEIGPGLVIHSPYGIYVGPVKVGPYCTLQGGVVLASGIREIGENVYFGSGAKVIGDVKIGNNVVVAANSLVITDIKDNTTVFGVPACIRLPGGRPKRFAWKTLKAETKADSKTASK